MSKELEFKIPIKTKKDFFNFIQKLKELKISGFSQSMTIKYDDMFNSVNKTGYSKIARLRKTLEYKITNNQSIIPSDEQIYQYLHKGTDEYQAWFDNLPTNEQQKYAQVHHYYLTNKDKSIIDGNESNYENEQEINHVTYDTIAESFRMLGHPPYFSKQKMSLSLFVPTLLTDYHFELVSVNGLIYLECEFVGEKNIDKNGENPIQIMEKVCTDLGLDCKDKDSRSWSVIIPK